MWQKMLQVGSGGGTSGSNGFFEQTLSITCDSDLVGQPMNMTFSDSQGNLGTETKSYTLKSDQLKIKVDSLGTYNFVYGTENYSDSYDLEDLSQLGTEIPINLSATLEDIVPAMTSSIAPYGQVIAYNFPNPFYFFDGKDNTSSMSSSVGAGQYIGYIATKSYRIKRVKIRPYVYNGNMGIRTFKVQASNDNFATIPYESSELTVPNNNVVQDYYFDIDTRQKYSGMRIYMTNTSYWPTGEFEIYTVQFYGN